MRWLNSPLAPAPPPGPRRRANPRGNLEPRPAFGPTADEGLRRTCRLKAANEKCPEQFNKFAACMDYNSNDFEKCRAEQAAFLEAFPPGSK